jgi:hypothetical protein
MVARTKEQKERSFETKNKGINPLKPIDYCIYCSVWSSCYATIARWADIPGQFLDNGSVNMFLQQQIQTL